MIHGCIDGFSRQIIYIHCADNNRAETVLNYFVDGVERLGLPIQVRANKGGENVGVATYMLEHPLHAPGRGSFISGRSVHNQLIERLWRDLFSGRTGLFYSLFRFMEDMQILNIDDEVHMYCLHCLPESDKLFSPHVLQWLEQPSIVIRAWNVSSSTMGSWYFTGFPP